MTNKNVIRYDDEVGSGVNTPRKKARRMRYVKML
jgi:hypothetical protein